MTALLFCTVAVVSLLASTAAHRNPSAPSRHIQRRVGLPFTGDVRSQSFEEYLATQGVHFNSLFDEPSYQPEGTSQAAVAPPRRRTSFEDQLPAFFSPGLNPLAQPYRETGGGARLPASYREPARRPYSRGDRVGRPQLSPFDDGELTSSRSGDGRPRRPAVAAPRPYSQRRHAVVPLRPAPASDDQPTLLEAAASPAYRRSGADRSDYVTPFSESDTVGFTRDASALSQPQTAADPRQDGFQLDIPKKQDKQRLEFQVHGQQGPHSYRFGYDTGTGYNRQFRFEERDGYGNTKGRYGFYDKSGKLQVVSYSATPKGGFHAVAGVGQYPKDGH